MKPERIQEKEALVSEDSESIESFLDAHSDWQVGGGGTELRRRYFFTSFGAASAFASFALAVASELAHSLRLEVSGAQLTLHLGGKGISQRDLAVAEAISRAG